MIIVKVHEIKVTWPQNDFEAIVRHNVWLKKKKMRKKIRLRCSKI